MRLRSLANSSLYFSRPLPPELHDSKNWKARAYSGSKGELFVPGVAIKTMLLDSASLDDDDEHTARLFVMRAVRVHGNMQMVDRSNVSRKLRLRDLVCKMHYVNPDGIKGGAKTQLKSFATVPEWAGSVCLHVGSEKLEEAYLRELFERAGALIGLGSMRLQTGGQNGAFKLLRISRPRSPM